MASSQTACEQKRQCTPGLSTDIPLPLINQPRTVPATGLVQQVSKASARTEQQDTRSARKAHLRQALNGGQAAVFCQAERHDIQRIRKGTHRVLLHTRDRIRCLLHREAAGRGVGDTSKQVNSWQMSMVRRSTEGTASTAFCTARRQRQGRCRDALSLACDSSRCNERLKPTAVPTCKPSPPRRRRTQCGCRAPGCAPRTARRAGCASSPRSSVAGKEGRKRLVDDSSIEQACTSCTAHRAGRALPRTTVARINASAGGGTHSVNRKLSAPHPRGFLHAAPHPNPPSCCRRAQRWSLPGCWVCPR